VLLVPGIDPAAGSATEEGSVTGAGAAS